MGEHFFDGPRAGDELVLTLSDPVDVEVTVLNVRDNGEILVALPPDIPYKVKFAPRYNSGTITLHHNVTYVLDEGKFHPLINEDARIVDEKDMAQYIRNRSAEVIYAP